MTAAENHESDTIRKRFAQEIAHERPGLTDLFRCQLRIVSRINCNAKHCARIGAVGGGA